MSSRQITIVNPYEMIKKLNKNTFNQLCNYTRSLIINWNKKNYSGLNVHPSIKNERDYEGLMNFKSAVDRSQCKLIKDLKKKIDDYPTTLQGLKNFLQDLNFKEEKKLNLKNPTSYRIEGSTHEEHHEMYNKIIKNSKQVKLILEIGFNSGNSAFYFLKKCPEANIVSIDLGLHNYGFYSKMFIDHKFPGRHLLLTGDSYIQAKALEWLCDKKFDYIFIDGDHAYESAYYDIFHCKAFADENTTVILDNVAPHRGAGIGPYLALINLYKEHYLHHIEHYELDNYEDGFATYKYVFDNFTKSDIDYVNIERYMPLWLLNGLVDYFKFIRDELTFNQCLEMLTKLLIVFEENNLFIDENINEKIKKLIK